MRILACCFFSALFFNCFCHRVERKAGDQAPPGKCCSFKWGGDTDLHWYACCNNCNEDPRPCDGKTYDSASDGDYCDDCGVDNKDGDGEKRSTFACGGCAVQDKMMEECSSGFRLFYEVPGFCWAFIYCFEDKCKEAVKKIGGGVGNKGPGDQGGHGNGTQGINGTSIDLPESCYNLKCEKGENVNNCPVDCCGEVNPKCKPQSGKCLPRCCAEPTCCDDSTDCSEDKCSECELKRCESKNNGPTSCTVSGNISSVTLSKTIGSTECKAGESYIHLGNTLFVNNGCRGEFYVCSEPCQNEREIITCESRRNRAVSCKAKGKIVSVSVAKKRSRSPCIAETSYTFKRDTLRVKCGCKADFYICYIPPPPSGPVGY